MHPTGEGAGGRPIIARHAELKRRAQGDVLVLPEQAVRIGGSGREILALCDGSRSRAAIRAELEARYPDTPGLGADVDTFLDELRTAGGLEEGEAERGRATRDTPRTAPATEEQAGPGAASTSAASADGPLNLIAELTYRCPLMCPYCSNPLAFGKRREALSSEDWARVFREASALGVVHVGLTGGEPSARRDLEEIVEAAIAADLYPHLVTAGVPLDPKRLDGLAERGLRSVQVSFQDATAERSDQIAGTASFEQKLAISRHTSELGLALTINCVLHRDNLDHTAEIIALAERLGADRLELANTQYHGWALRNRAALMPSREQLARAQAVVAEAQARQASIDARLRMLFVLPDYFSERPKPCMGGWGRLAIVIDPTGRVLPCHEAGEIPELEFWNVQDRSLADCWTDAPGLRAYRGTSWMPEPCRSCSERERDFGGCRCQAYRLVGDASLTDPACALSPHHDRITRARSERADSFAPRR